MIFFLLVTVSCTNEAADLNVGTTLFTKADNCKECWSSESLALLTSRMILEDLLPSTSILVIDSNEFVSDLVEYFRMILETVRQETHGKTKHITLLALTDLLGINFNSWNKSSGLAFIFRGLFTPRGSPYSQIRVLRWTDRLRQHGHVIGAFWRTKVVPEDERTRMGETSTSK